MANRVLSFVADAEQKKQNIFQRALGGGDKNHQSSSNGASNKMKVSEPGTLSLVLVCARILRLFPR
jgi:hypothetical protein